MNRCSKGPTSHFDHSITHIHNHTHYTMHEWRNCSSMPAKPKNDFHKFIDLRLIVNAVYFSLKVYSIVESITEIKSTSLIKYNHKCQLKMWFDVRAKKISTEHCLRFWMNDVMLWSHAPLTSQWARSQNKISAASCLFKSEQIFIHYRQQILIYITLSCILVLPYILIFCTVSRVV